MPGLFDMPVRGSHSGTDFSSSAPSSQGGAFTFSLPTPAGGDAVPNFSAAPKGNNDDTKDSSGGGSGGMFRPFTFGTPARAGAAGAARNDDTTSMTDEDEDDEGSQFEFDQQPPPASAADEVVEPPATSSATLVDTAPPPSTGTFQLSIKLPTAGAGTPAKPVEKSQISGIQFNLPGMGMGAGRPAMVAGSGAAGDCPPKSKQGTAMGQDCDMPAAGEDAFSHMSGKTGESAHTAADDDADDDAHKCSQESASSHATSCSAESAYTCETRSVVTAIAPTNNKDCDAESVRHDDDEQTLRGGDDEEVDVAALETLAQEHSHLKEQVDAAVEKFVTTQNAMRAKLLTAGQEFSAIAENAGSLQVSLAQTLSDLLAMKLQLSIRKVGNHKLMSKLQHSLEDCDAREKRHREEAEKFAKEDAEEETEQQQENDADSSPQQEKTVKRKRDENNAQKDSAQTMTTAAQEKDAEKSEGKRDDKGAQQSKSSQEDDNGPQPMQVAA